jgi:hypothetical protein
MRFPVEVRGTVTKRSRSIYPQLPKAGWSDAVPDGPTRGRRSPARSRPAPARALGWSDRGGRLAPGLYGDVIAVRRDPFADVTRLESVEGVVKGGLLLKR